MSDQGSGFRSRVSRIEQAHRDRAQGEFVLRADGLLVPKTRTRARRFVFPVKGLIAAYAMTMGVKAYLIWSLGDDTYGLAVLELLNGSGPERLAGLLLQPDTVSTWLVGLFERGAQALVVLRGPV